MWSSASTWGQPAEPGAGAGVPVASAPAIVWRSMSPRLASQPELGQRR
jgi:hypothetical protein